MGGLVKGVRLGWCGRVVGYSEVTPGCEPQRTSADPSASPFLRSGSGRDDIAQFNHFRPIPIRSSRKPAAFATNTNAPRRSERRQDAASVVGASRAGAVSRTAGALLGYGFRSFLRGSFLFRDSLANHLHLDVRGDFAMQPDGHFVVAQRLDRLVERDLAAIDLEPAGCQLEIGRASCRERV